MKGGDVPVGPHLPSLLEYLGNAAKTLQACYLTPLPSEELRRALTMFNSRTRAFPDLLPPQIQTDI